MNRFDEFARLEAEVKAAQERLNAFRNDWADNCGVKVGDIVHANGFGYSGKKMRIESVRVDRCWRGGIYIKTVGYVLKKDGTTGNQRAEYNQKIEPEES